MKKIIFFSRHELRQGVVDWFKKELKDNNIEVTNSVVMFPPKLDDFIKFYEIFEDKFDAVIGVFPIEYAIKLAMSGKKFYFLKNSTSAQEKNQFKCFGLFEVKPKGIKYFKVDDIEESVEIKEKQKNKNGNIQIERIADISELL